MSIETVKKALVASFASRIWSAGLNIVVVPIYLRLIGIESYGLIGLFSSLQVLVSFLDFGLGSTLIREFSRVNNSPEQKQRMSDLAKACELLYILVAVFITIILFVFIPWIVNSWIKLGQLNHSVAEKALMIATLS